MWWYSSGARGGLWNSDGWQEESGALCGKVEGWECVGRYHVSSECSGEGKCVWGRAGWGRERASSTYGEYRKVHIFVGNGYFIKVVQFLKVV